MWSKDEEDAHKIRMRQAELERRHDRRQRLINEAELDKETLSPADKIIHEAAIKRIKAQEEDYQSDIHGGYWRRLFNAIRGK